MFSNSLVYHTSEGILLSIIAFLFLIILSTESSFFLRKLSWFYV